MARIQKTPKGLRLHIGLFGRRNVGKSSILNAMTRQKVSIVSAQAGTTTDPVEKAMEFLPLGPVLFIDTAGIDDEGALGQLRVERSRQVLDRTELAIIVSDGLWTNFEQNLLAEFQQRKVAVVVVFNKNDLRSPDPQVLADLQKQEIPVLQTSMLKAEAVQDLRQAILESVPESFYQDRPILSDLLQSGDTVVFVIPIDKEAPKGRIILPQVQALRDLLDHDINCLVVTDQGLKAGLENLKKPPALVVTDSQAFQKVADITPPEIAMTSFSILFARLKGDLTSLFKGSLAIAKLQQNDRVLVAETCSHHPIEGDIGREKIPRLLQQKIAATLQFDTVQGHDFAKNLQDYKLVIHCGGCVNNRREMLSRILRCNDAGVPISNYGLTIAYTLDILPRALAPFPELQSLLEQEQL